MFKGISAKKLAEQFPELKTKHGVWTRTYYVGTAGTVTEETISEVHRRMPRYLKTYVIPVQSDLHEKRQELSKIAGRIYSKTVSFVRKMHKRKGFWPSEGTTQKYILRWAENIDIHTHSKQALVQLYFEALRSFFSNMKQNKNARPPFKTKKYQTFIWKNTAVKLLKTAHLSFHLVEILNLYTFLLSCLERQRLELYTLSMMANINCT